jgi:primosomal protein N' (replication factor Y)
MRPPEGGAAGGETPPRPTPRGDRAGSGPGLFDDLAALEAPEEAPERGRERESAAAEVRPGRLREIEKLLDAEPALTPALLELTRFLADYYRCSWGEALSAALPGSVKRRVRKGERARDEASRGEERTGAPEAGSAAPFEPTPAQREALDLVLELVRGRAFATALVHGVTGSGKTEIYLRAIEETLAQGRAALLLVPEIALTPQTTARLAARFGRVAVLHSLQGDAERARQWEAIRRGEARVVVGPRSAVFAPAKDLGLIVVDEEHEGSFKQDSPPRYHARDLALVRARLEGAVAVLGSATPSLESYAHAQAGRYRAVYLGERATRAALPDVEVIDLRVESREVKGFPFISRRLAQALEECLGRKEQAILFLNRRGFATFLQCRACKEVLTCGDCDVALAFHKGEGAAVCHYCETRRPPPRTCPRCLASEVQYFGFGTERVEDEVRRRFPAARVKRVDSDAVEDAAALEAALASFGAGEVDILIGTQMVAKGLDFPRVTVVGVISADTAINLPDFRAAERTFQLVTQVTGRAGRAGLSGRAIVQTFCPEHAAIRAAVAHDSLGFLEKELGHRRALGYPPFARLARIVVSGPEEEEAARAAALLGAALESARAEAGALAEKVRILGPAPAPIAVLRGRYRFVLLVKAPDRAPLRPLLDAADAPPRLPARVRVALDVDPVSMM